MPNERPTRIGFLVPPVNPTVEEEMIALAGAMPAGAVSVHFTRMAVPAEPGHTPEARNRWHVEKLPEDAALLAMVKPRVMVLAHTVMSYLMGVQGEAEMAARVRRETGIALVTAVGGVLAALARLEVRRIAFCAPYNATSTAMGKAHFEALGIEVVSAGHLENSRDVYATSAQDACALGRRLDRPQAQAVVLSGTGMPTLDAVARLERELGKPVVAASAAMMWHALGVAGVRAPIAGFGRLLGSG